MPKGIPRTKKEMEERRREIAYVAADLIFKKGFNETSVSQIAKAAGIGKSTLYDFFSTKDEIILLLMDEPLAEMTHRAEAIIASDDSVANRLNQVMHMHLDILMRDRAFILKLAFEAQRLSLEAQQKYQVKRYTYQDLIVGLVEEGIADGSFREIDAAMVMKILLASMSSVVYTTRPAGTPQEMLDKVLDMLLSGLLQT
jgi:AcrR family transcriptional regulator